MSGAGARGSGASVLLVSTNRERRPYPVLPNGAACVATALEAAGHRVRFEDLCFEKSAEAAGRRAARAARETRPDVIALSIRNIDNSDALALRHYTPEAAQILGAMRDAAPAASVVAGGAAFGVAPEALFSHLGVDYGVAGDGERASVALVDALAAGRNGEGIAGVVRRDGDRIVFSPPAEDATLDTLPQVRLDRWVNVRRYERHGATVPVQTKRGCVYRCVYCTYRNVEGFGYRLREPAAVAGEIERLSFAAGVSHFDFVDSTFNSPPGHAIAVCEAIAKLRRPVSLETTNFTPAAVSSDLLAAMRAAGFRALGITAESASDRVLERLDKGFTAAKAREAAEIVERAGIRSLWIFLIGGPGESAETLEETLAFAATRLRRGDAVYATVGLRIYPGTTLHRIAVSEGVVEAGDRLLSPSFYFSSALRFDDAVLRLRRFAAGHPRFMFSADTDSPVLPFLTRIASLTRLPRPHWRYMGAFQRISRAIA